MSINNNLSGSSLLHDELSPEDCLVHKLLMKNHGTKITNIEKKLLILHSILQILPK